MPPAATARLLLAFSALLLCCGFSTAAAASSGDASGGVANEVLHQPLFPIEWTPQPPPPAPDFTSDPTTPDGPVDFFPPAPAGGGGATTLSTPTTVAANVPIAPAGDGDHHGGPVKAAIVAAGAAAAAAVALLAFACAFLITYRARRRGDSQKLLGPDRRSARHHAAPSAAEFLYVGTVEPTTPGRHHGPTAADLVGSPYRKLRSERARRDDPTDHPSPELRPLPPLRRVATMGSSDEDAYYTPRQRSGGSGSGGGVCGETWSEASASTSPTTTTTTASRRSLPSLTSDCFPPVAAIAAPTPPPARSRRTPPRTRFSAGSTPDIKQVISPFPWSVQSSKPTQPPPARPPPPPPPPPPPTPKPPFSAIPRSAEPPSGPTSRRQLLKTLPPEGPHIAMPKPITEVKSVDNNGSTSMRKGDDTVDALVGSGETPPKLKPLHLDNVRATSDRAMVWDQLKSSSFQLDEDMIDALFMNNSIPAVLDPKKAQNIGILLRALNVTRVEVSDVLLDGTDGAAAPVYIGAAPDRSGLEGSSDGGEGHMHRLQRWMAVHGRNYSSAQELRFRLHVYNDNMKYIHEFNSKAEAVGHTYHLREGPFTDLLEEEFSKLLPPPARIPPPPVLRADVHTATAYSMSAYEPPSNVDWREAGAVTDVKNEETCGSCWAFATIAALEGLHKIRSGELVTLSEQELVDCDTIDEDCVGGSLDTAFEWIKSNGGVSSELDYPYTGQKGTCDASKAANHVAGTAGYGFIDKYDEHALMGVVAKDTSSPMRLETTD